MFILRSVTEHDLENLYQLSQLQVFINLPQDKAALKEKITNSIQRFSDPSERFEDNHYIFVLEDLETKTVIGVSMIHGKHGTEREPHFFLKVSREHKYSQSLNMGFVHGTLKFGAETDGWTEIGGLVLHPKYRGNAHKLGKQLSFIRFLYMSNYPKNFTDIIHTELMPPFDDQGHSPLWEAIGRRFMNMDYVEADLLSRKNKEFILSLYPVDTIYGTLLPLNARNAIGKVGETTKPVKGMLEKIGFHYTEEVDPFDGGPHFRARLNDLTIIREKFHGDLEFSKSPFKKKFLIDISTNANSFEAVMASGEITKEGKLKVNLEDYPNIKNIKSTNITAIQL